MGEDEKQNPWDEVVDGWIEFNKSGRNIHRDYLNLPAFMAALPKPKKNQIGIEIGGGEGTLARQLAEKGYRVHSTDISEKMVREARHLVMFSGVRGQKLELRPQLALGRALSSILQKN